MQYSKITESKYENSRLEFTIRQPGPGGVLSWPFRIISRSLRWLWLRAKRSTEDLPPSVLFLLPHLPRNPRESAGVICEKRWLTESRRRAMLKPIQQGKTSE